MQGRCGPTGEVALITLPCPVLGAVVTRYPGGFALHQPDAAALSRGRALRLLRGVGVPVTGRFVLRLNLPLGGGAGASTAALVALARAAGADDARIAAACLAVEGASDPLIIRSPERWLWASRRGVALQAMPALPRMEILGGFCGPPQRTDPQDSAFPAIDDLVAAWPAASRDLPALAALTSLSARRTLALRGPAGDATEALARRLGALGFAIGHTGPARALIFAPGRVPDGAEALLRLAGWARITRFRIGGDHA